MVGDAHQPMHISRKEDKGGNTIQLRFDDKGTNLHSLWDSGLIGHEASADMARDYDTATPAEIRQWQADSPLEWIWESYQISSRLYAGVKPGQQIDEAYYQKYIPVIRKRVDQAGIRLAGELNKLFDHAEAPKGTLTKVLENKATQGIAENIDLKEAGKFVGKTVQVTGQIYTVKDIGSMVLANMGAAYPNQLLTLAFKGDAKEAGAKLAGKTVTITGQVIDYKGKPEIVVTGLGQLK